MLKALGKQKVLLGVAALALALIWCGVATGMELVLDEGESGSDFLPIFSLFPFVMMAGKVTNMDDWVPPFNSEEQEEARGPPTPPIPVSCYLRFIPCLLAEFLPVCLHAAVYQNTILYGKTWFIANVPLVGQITKVLDENLSVNSLFIGLMTTIVIASPILVGIQLYRLGIMDRGWKVMREQPMGWAKLGTPSGLYGGGLAIEGWTLWLRFQPELIVFKDRTAIPDDPGTVIGVAVLTFLFTTIIGIWTGSKIYHFKREFGRY